MFRFRHAGAARDDIRGGVGTVAGARRRDVASARSSCRPFANWLSSQTPDYDDEIMLAAVLAACSRNVSRAGDLQLVDQLDHAAAAVFFSRKPYEMSIWTQFELADYRSGGRNAEKVMELKRDLSRRGWKIDETRN